jgi:hypothetical protein
MQLYVTLANFISDKYLYATICNSMLRDNVHGNKKPKPTIRAANKPTF